jgi:serpin B
MWSFFRKSSTSTTTDDSLAFALDLYGRLRNADENLVCSPWSVQSVLGLLLAGARGETAAALRAVPTAPSVASVAFQSANSLWIHDEVTLLPAFIEAVSARSGASLQMLPSHNPAAAINQWVGEQTLQRIPRLLDPLSELTRVVFVNAIALDARWATAFDPESTVPWPFHTGRGSRVHVPMMCGRETVPYVDDEPLGAQGIELRYRDSSLAMILILPHEDISLQVLESRVGTEGVAQVLRNLQNRVVDIQMPRFSFRNRIDPLGQALREQGLGVVFDPGRADFSGISGEPPGTDRSLVVETVVQEATIETNEGGTVATAATAAHVREASALLTLRRTYPVFRADRPFLFLIHDHETGAIVFIGRVVDPGGHVAPPEGRFLHPPFGRRLG